MYICARLIKIAICYNCVIMLENPFMSFFFDAPPIAKLISTGQNVLLDFCQFGTRWRKRTRFVAWNCSALNDMKVLCKPSNGLCNCSGRRHIILTGTDPVSHIKWTKLAEPYPNKLCTFIASHLVSAFSELRHYFVCRNSGCV